MKLYHGSPLHLTLIEPKTPRGNDQFNTQTGVYLTDNIIEATLYSLARDVKRLNKSWAIKYKNDTPYLILRNDKWPSKYQLNEIGYLHIIDINDYEQSPYNKHEYIVKHCVKPSEIIKITKQLEQYIIYISKDEFENLD